MAGWRTADVPWWALALAIVVLVVAVLGLASLGGVGIALAALLIAGAVGIVLLWSKAPWDDRAGSQGE